MSSYAFDQGWVHERKRLSLVQHVYDPASIRRLEVLGSMEGWRCLEVGAGAGSIAVWLSRRVGPQGSVVASDLDSRFLDELRIPNLQVLRHDIVKDDLPESSFDLIHSRLLIHLLPAREKVLAKLASALRPGGWLLCEVFDNALVLYPPEDPIRDAVLDLIHAGAGSDKAWARRLPEILQRLGFTEVHAEADAEVYNGGSPAAELYRLTWLQFRDRVLEKGILSAKDFDSRLARLSDPQYWVIAPLMIAAHGRRPLA